MQTVEASAHLQSQTSFCEELKIGLVLGENANKKIADHYLPIDVVIEILCRLPVKSLTVSKCVSKSWNKLISHVCLPRLSSNVCVLRLYRGRTRRLSEGWLFSGTLPELNGPNSNPEVNGHDIYYHEIDCCNGLSLCVAGGGSRHFVVNIATQQRFYIPEPLKHTGWNFSAIAFDPIQSSDYKIVRPNLYSDIPSLDIFSSEIGKWVRHNLPGDWVEHLFVSEFHSPMNRGMRWAKANVYLDGMLYLLTRGEHLIRFDLKSPAVSAEVIEVPCGAKRRGLIGHSRGVLYYVNYDNEFILSMWQLDFHSTGTSTWILKHSICTNDMLDKNPGILDTLKLKDRRPCRLFEPFGIHPFSDIIFLGLQGRVYSYHLGSHKCEHFWWTAECMSWRYDFVYPVSYSYVNVRDFRKADLNDTARDVKLAQVSGDLFGKKESGHDTVDQRGEDASKIGNSRIL